MKDYTDLQREIMNKIVEVNLKSQPSSLSSILDDFFPKKESYYYGVSAFMNPNPKIIIAGTRLTLYINSNYFHSEISSKYGMEGIKVFADLQENFLVEIVDILAELEEKKMVTFYGNNDNLTIGYNFPFQEKDFTYQGFDQVFAKKLEKYLQYKKIISNQTLKSFIANSYRTDDDYRKYNSDKREEEKIRQTSFQIKLLSLSLIIAIVGNVYQMFFNPNNQKKQNILNQTNYTQITNKIEVTNRITVSSENNISIINTKLEIQKLFNEIDLLVNDYNNVEHGFYTEGDLVPNVRKTVQNKLFRIIELSKSIDDKNNITTASNYIKNLRL